MQVTLNIQNDAELRAVIKDMIKGQVMNVAREEITQVVRDELRKKIENRDTRYLDRLLSESMQKVIADTLRNQYDIGGWSDRWIIPIVGAIVSAHVEKAIKDKDWNKMIDDLAKQKVKDMLK